VHTRPRRHTYPNAPTRVAIGGILPSKGVFFVFFGLLLQGKKFTRTSGTFAALGPAQNAQKIEQGGHIKGMTLELKDLLRRYARTLKLCPALS
jgi:hypothetical protein